jgi:ferredoxin-type protein NapH
MDSPKTKIGPEIMVVAALYTIAVVLWRSTGLIFYLFNFVYIGTAIGLGMGLARWLPRDRQQWARRATLLMVGLYMLGFLGFVQRENMQIEGFWLLLFSGVFAAAVLHYTIAKIAGPLLFGRAWCGWACWTAMVLDLLPYRRPHRPRVARFGAIRYIHFLASLGIVLCAWFIIGYRPLTSAGLSQHEMYWLVAGNTFYYVTGIALAVALKDNRAFCKYVCPITTFLKASSRFALLKIKGDATKCTKCGMCEKACPMDIRIRDYITAGTRILSTECIFCQSCVESCPTGALSITVGLDRGSRELLHERRRGT